MSPACAGLLFKARDLIRFGRIYDILAIVTLSRDVNLFTQEMDASGDLRKLLGGVLTTLAGIGFTQCGLRVSDLRDKFGGDLNEMISEIDERQPKMGQKLRWTFVLGLLLILVGIGLYVTRRSF